MIVYVLTALPHSGAAYIAALTVSFFTLALAFVIALDVILAQPVDRT